MDKGFALRVIHKGQVLFEVYDSHDTVGLPAAWMRALEVLRSIEAPMLGQNRIELSVCGQPVVVH